LSRDDDLAVVGYGGGGGAWVYELTRGRPIARVRDWEGLGVLSSSSSSSVPASVGVVGVAITSEGGVAVAVVSSSSSSSTPPSTTHILMFDTEALTRPSPTPTATLLYPGKVTHLGRVRGGGTGDIEGPGACLSVGSSDGRVSLVDSGTLEVLVEWRMPGGVGVQCMDVSPCTSFLVVGGSNGTVAAFALPAFSLGVPINHGEYAASAPAPINSAGGAGASVPEKKEEKKGGGFLGGLFGRR